MSIGELLKIAAVNTGLGMGTVFLMLVLISAVIALFRFIPQKERAAAPTPVKAQEQRPMQEKSEEDDLIPAIIAAVLAAAGEETAEDAYIVRAVKRRS